MNILCFSSAVRLFHHRCGYPWFVTVDEFVSSHSAEHGATRYRILGRIYIWTLQLSEYVPNIYCISAYRCLGYCLRRSRSNHLRRATSGAVLLWWWHVVIVINFSIIILTPIILRRQSRREETRSRRVQWNSTRTTSHRKQFVFKCLICLLLWIISFNSLYLFE